MNSSSDKSLINTLKEKAHELKRLKDTHGQRRPILIEFCGTPKSGKSTTITALNIFLKRNEFSTAVVQEMASVCPVENKTHPFFNSWTLFSSLSETIKHYSENKVDFIIVDRSIFDALCWFEWLNKYASENCKYLDDATYSAYLELLLKTDLWASLFSLVLVFTATPETALNREFAYLVTDQTGSIMNEIVLRSFNDSINSVHTKYHSYFRTIEVIDTSDNKKPEEINRTVTEKTLNSLLNLFREEVGYIPASSIPDLKEGLNDFDILKYCKVEFKNREEVEKDILLIQPIPVAVITNKAHDRVLVVKKGDRRTEPGSPEHNRYLLYIGGHIRREDCKNPSLPLLKLFENTLSRELFEEIGESLIPNGLTPFLIYNQDTEKSRKHLAICFVLELNDFDNKKFKIITPELIKKTGLTKSGHSLSIKDALALNERFEPWSALIFKYVFNTKPPTKMPSLFDFE